jgi:hypothetical protein
LLTDNESSGSDNDPDKKNKKKSSFVSDDFDLNKGKVIDTLKKDYPDIFTLPLDFSIYIKDIEVSDPNGVEFHGLKTYMSLF